MLKLKDILAAANAKVAEYMAQGYMISWMNASFGYKFRVDLEKNGDRVRVKVDSFHNWELASSIEGLNLQVVRISCADAFEDRAVEPLYSKNFYDLSRYARLSRKSPQAERFPCSLSRTRHSSRRRSDAHSLRSEPQARSSRSPVRIARRS